MWPDGSLPITGQSFSRNCRNSATRGGVGGSEVGAAGRTGSFGRIRKSRSRVATRVPVPSLLTRLCSRLCDPVTLSDSRAGRSTDRRRTQSLAVRRPSVFPHRRSPRGPARSEGPGKPHGMLKWAGRRRPIHPAGPHSHRHRTLWNEKNRQMAADRWARTHPGPSPRAAQQSLTTSASSSSSRPAGRAISTY